MGNDEVGAASLLVRADGVVKELSRVIKCRSLFSTHYHTLMPDFEADPAIYLAHMGCLADAENADEAQTDLDITFLYTLTDGACPQRCVHSVGLAGTCIVCQPAPRHSLKN
jgi:DNA mismatch repair ATPase MutS